jgi:hypothetical protein
MPFDEVMLPDVEEVLDASALLEITEFEVFRIAYRGWFGEPASDRTLEPFFTDYMFHDAVPVWVRHFTRHVLALSRAGRLEPREFGIVPEPYRSDTAAKGVRYLIIAVFWMSLLLLLAHFASRLLSDNQCFFPPCY